MSELTPCNYCSLRNMRYRAEKAGEVITMIGQDVYRHPSDVDVKKLPAPDRQRYWRAWFMELTDHCVC